MVGVTWNNKKYLMASSSAYLKSQSIEDNLYFTIREIFLNIEQEFKMYEANEINAKLSNQTPWEDRDDKFKYLQLFKNPDFVTYVLGWLNSIKQTEFDFEFETARIDLNSDIITNEYIEFELWWKRLVQLKQDLSNLLNKN